MLNIEYPKNSSVNSVIREHAEFSFQHVYCKITPKNRRPKPFHIKK